MTPRLPRLVILAAAALLLAAACAVVPIASGPGVEVGSVRASVPAPTLALCLTRELRIRLASRRTTTARPAYRLEVEIVGLDQQVGSVARLGDELHPMNETLRLTVRARLVDRTTGRLRWGPQVYREDESAAEGATALATAAASEVSASTACRALARHIAEDLAFFLVGAGPRTDDPEPVRR